MSGRDRRRLVVGGHSDAERYRASWLESMAPYWHVVARSADLEPGAVVPVGLLGRPFALWRGANGSLAAVGRQCPHRGVDLSLGAVDAQGCLLCPYHSWSFRSDGSCASIPQLDEGRVLPGADTVATRVAEAHGFVWMCVVASGEERRSFPSFQRARRRHALVLDGGADGLGSAVPSSGRELLRRDPLLDHPSRHVWQPGWGASRTNPGGARWLVGAVRLRLSGVRPERGAVGRRSEFLGSVPIRRATSMLGAPRRSERAWIRDVHPFDAARRRSLHGLVGLRIPARRGDRRRAVCGDRRSRVGSGPGDGPVARSHRPAARFP